MIARRGGMIRRSRNGVPVLGFFAFVAVLLLVPFGWSELPELAAAQRRVQDAERIEESLVELETLFEFGPALRMEWATTTALAGVTLLDSVPNAAISRDAVAEIESLQVAARARVDLVTSESVDKRLQEEIEAFRTSVSNGVTQFQDIDPWFGAIVADLETEVSQSLRRVTDANDFLGGSVPLHEYLHAAELVVDFQRNEADQFLAWARVSFPALPVQLDDASALAEGSATSGYLSAQIESLFGDYPELLDQWGRYHSKLKANSFHREVEAAIQTGFTEAVSPQERDFASAIDALADRPEGLAAFVGTLGDYLSDLGSVQPDAVEMRGVLFSSIREQVTEIRADAARARLEALAVLGLSAAVGTIAVLLLARNVARPLHRLAEAAGGLNAGEPGLQAPLIGPSEVREVAKALNDSTKSIGLVEAQANALASGNMSDPVLQKRAAGRLGSALHAAIDNLANALDERETYRQELAHEATHDGLTGLPNRSSIMSTIKGALAPLGVASRTTALMFIDLDGFKEINDAHGHQAGDTVLCAVSERIQATIPPTSTVGRLGGDEFVVLIEGVSGTPEVVEMAEQISRAVAEPCLCDGIVLRAGASIGIAIADCPNFSAEQLVHEADLAVYRAKEPHRPNIVVCDAELRVEHHNKTTTEAALRTALVRCEFEFCYQPIVDSATGVVESLEALLRWNRPGVGIVLPADFIPIAEQSQLIVELDKWVLHHVASQIDSWNHQTAGSGVPVSVNISGRHLTSGSLGEHVSNALSGSDVHPRQLTVEITETSLLEDLQNASDQLAELRRMGTEIALDDFGTGYMSLSVLRALPVSTLKIDKSFINNLNDDRERTLVKLIIDTGHLLGCRIIAEGVETTQQHQLLTSLGVDAQQGFLFSKPIPPGNVTRFLEKTNAAHAQADSHQAQTNQTT